MAPATSTEAKEHTGTRARGARKVRTGRVVSDKMEKTIIVRRDYLNYVPKFKRYERRRSNVAAHSPPCLEIKTGDKVKLAECRSISKTVSFVVIEKLEEGSSGSKS